MRSLFWLSRPDSSNFLAFFPGLSYNIVVQPDLQELNVSVLDGENSDVAALISACDPAPFLAENRLVITRRLLASLGSPTKRKGRKASSSSGTKDAAMDSVQKLGEYLIDLPSWTVLVLVEDEFRPGKTTLAPAVLAKARVEEFKALRDRDLHPWIEDRARKAGCSIAPDAVGELALGIGSDLRALAGELEKLAMYAGGRRITVEDVRLLSVPGGANIFGLLDAIGKRDRSRSLDMLLRLLHDGGHPQGTLVRLIGHVRSLIQVTELAKSRMSPDDIAARLGMHPYACRKALAQKANFQLRELLNLHEELERTDLAIKTGRIEPEVALELLVMSLCGGPRKRGLAAPYQGA